MLDAMALKNVGRWILSLGACKPSSGSAKPIKIVGMPRRAWKRSTTGMVPPERKKMGDLPKARRYALDAAWTAV